MVRTPSMRSLVGLISYQGNTPLHLAADRGHIEVARTLLGAGADRQAKVSVGQDSKLTLGR
jgi:ankyrin repeat protein